MMFLKYKLLISTAIFPYDLYFQRVKINNLSSMAVC